MHRSFIQPLNTKSVIFPPIYGNQQQLQQNYFMPDQLSENNKNRQAVENTQQLILNITAMANQKHEHFCHKNRHNGNFVSAGNFINNKLSRVEETAREYNEMKTRPKVNFLIFVINVCILE